MGAKVNKSGWGKCSSVLLPRDPIVMIVDLNFGSRLICGWCKLLCFTQ
jgi:hypothetical protein